MPTVNSTQLELAFDIIRPIVIKSSRELWIKSYTMDDYLQEGRIVLWELLADGVERDNLPKYFKVAFRQHLMDLIRATQAEKRRYCYDPYVDVHTIEPYVVDPTSNLMNQMIAQEMQESFLESLPYSMLEPAKRIICGQPVDRNLKYRIKKRLSLFIEDYEK